MKTHKRKGGCRSGWRVVLSLALLATMFGPGLLSWRGLSVWADDSVVLAPGVPVAVTITNTAKQVVLTNVLGRVNASVTLINAGPGPVFLLDSTNYATGYYIAAGGSLGLGPLTKPLTNDWWGWLPAAGTNATIYGVVHPEFRP